MINLFSTEKRAKVALQPLEPGKIKMYVCGPTVYDHCHIGHARPAVVFDTIRRYLEYSGFAVTFLSNITDVDDKIINRANSLGISCKALTTRFQDEYEADMAALGVRSPTIRPKATEHIKEMIDLIQTLMDKGVAYTTSRGVWFDVTKFADYGRLSGKVTDDETTEHRVETDSEKRHAQDFALWKFTKPGEPEWPSPWGAGRPGWHIECSAMSGKYCAMQLDIHGGGADLVFPHHENELAQSEAATGKTFAQYWIHNGFITVAKDNGEEAKMGKSKGNAFWLREAFKICGAAALRFWILGTHYRMPLLYKPELLDSAKNSLDRLYTCLEALDKALTDFTGAVEKLSAWNAADAEARLTLTPGEGLSGVAVNAGQKFITAMNDDFNTPQALSALFELVNAANSAVAQKADAGELAAARAMVCEILGVLGLPLSRPDTGSASADQYLQILVDLRNAARAEKDFATSDAIRDRLAAAGVELKDQAGKTTWTVK